MTAKRELLISKGWMQAVAIVALIGFLLLGILTYRTYTDGRRSLLKFSALTVSFSLPAKMCLQARKFF